MNGTIWITSDTHFNHNKDFIWKPRGFTNINDMNEAIIEKWNATVKDEDIVYHLGDVMMGADLEAGLRLVQKLKGQKYLAFGNHDTDARMKAFAANHFFKEIQMGYRLKLKKTTFIATHYPTITANGNDNRVLGLYGHTHQQTNFFSDEAGIRTYMYHVGVDSHDCTPVNLEELVAEIKNLGKE